MNGIAKDHVRDALVHYYDPTALTDHPLAQYLVALGTPQRMAAQSLRQAIADALERLRPDGAVPYDRPEWLRYRVIVQRYLECHAPDRVCQELGLGRTSLFKYQKAGIEALAGELSRGLTREGEDVSIPDALSTSAPAPSIARKEARRAASAAVHRPVRVDALLDGLALMLASKAERDHVCLTIRRGSDLPTISGDPALLKQALLTAFAEALGYARGRDVTVSVEVQSGSILWSMEGLPPAFHVLWDTQDLDSRAVAEELLHAHGGRCSSHAVAGGAMLEIQTPVSESGYILVIDDDPAVSGLYLKYLAPLGLIIESSIGAKEAWTLLRERIPLLVLLDVLMPDTDGWDILQQLRSDQATRDVPVIVCSVLADPNMAIAMGATAVLSKPIDPMDMFAQVSQILRLEGSAGAPSS